MVNSRQKGKRAERELSGLLRALGFKGARRGQQYKGTEESPDIVDAIEGVYIECKNREQLNIYDAIQTAADEAVESDVPIVIHRRKSRPWVVSVRLVDLLDFAYRVKEEFERSNASGRDLHVSEDV